VFRFGIGYRDLRGACALRAKPLSVATLRGTMRVVRSSEIAAERAS
jgi:hypothetical protein